LNPNESAADEKLFQREALVPRRAAQFYVAGEQAALEALGVRPAAVIRVGRAKSVSGRCLVTSVEPLNPGTVTASRLRVELRTPGVFVDEWGVAAAEPDRDDIQRAFGVAGRVVGRRIRWTTVGGWHFKSNRPKPEDPAVIPGSVYTIELDEAVSVPDLVHCLGLRAAEGYGWASVGEATDE
jgi:CRISPR-associated protein Csx10